MHFTGIGWMDAYVRKPIQYSLADLGVDLDLRCIENVLTDYDSQHLQKQEST